MKLKCALKIFYAGEHTLDAKRISMVRDRGISPPVLRE